MMRKLIEFLGGGWQAVVLLIVAVILALFVLANLWGSLDDWSRAGTDNGDQCYVQADGDVGGC
jgi:hypothetical protein